MTWASGCWQRWRTFLLAVRCVVLGLPGSICDHSTPAVFDGVRPIRQPKAAVAVPPRLYAVAGAYDLRFGSVVRGYAALSLACFVILVGLVQLKLEGPLRGMPGIITSIAVGYVPSTFPLPTPPGVVVTGAEASPIWAHYFWTFFWAYPYAKVFWPFVGLCALVVLVYHATRLRRIWQG